jgi:hypothetical protein
MEKGIILQAAEVSYNKADNSITVQGNTNAREIRKSLLYWDKIAIPRNNNFSFGSEDITTFRSKISGRNSDNSPMESH